MYGPFPRFGLLVGHFFFFSRAPRQSRIMVVDGYYLTTDTNIILTWLYTIPYHTINNSNIFLETVVSLSYMNLYLTEYISYVVYRYGDVYARTHSPSAARSQVRIHTLILLGSWWCYCGSLASTR